ncbi:MAG: hypothetical protein HC796_09895 [Synechococcaceae cyanobacterium RL_1_2]|nr:hypothetical protein [Synechococcaceae cyanobacterium RL_1_2]
MFILKKQDVEITSMKHPKQEKQIPILKYQDQSFRLISVFAAQQEEEARNFWRDLTDNQKKFAILLEEPERFSVWGRINLDRFEEEGVGDLKMIPLTQASLVILQTVYIDVVEILGNRQEKLFVQEMNKIFQQWKFPKAENQDQVNVLLNVDDDPNNDPLGDLDLPSWEEHHIITLLQELHRIALEHFGNDNFATGIGGLLADMATEDQGHFFDWLNRSPLGKMWQQ